LSAASEWQLRRQSPRALRDVGVWLSAGRSQMSTQYCRRGRRQQAPEKEAPKKTVVNEGGVCVGKLMCYEARSVVRRQQCAHAAAAAMYAFGSIQAVDSGQQHQQCGAV